MRAQDAGFVVVVCTRERPVQLARTLDALDAQTLPGFPILVVDQSEASDQALAARAASDPRLTVLRDDGRGLSRARNLAWRSRAEEWLVFVDDDCRPEPAWADALAGELSDHPEAALVSGVVAPAGGRVIEGEEVHVTIFPVVRARLRRGRWTHPGAIGFGVCMAVRRTAAERVGGWDERLGPGAEDFPAADDMDFNFRLLRAGGAAWVSPGPRAVHEQWRDADELTTLLGGYLRAWSAFAVKHVRTGDPLGGAWLWLIGVADVLHEVKTALEHRSRLRLRIARAKLAGLATGTRRALERSW